MSLNLFIEGLQGSGKSTLAHMLTKELPDYQAYREGDISPVELAWCSYLTKTQYQDILVQYPDIADEIKQYTVQENDRYLVAYTRILTDYSDFHRKMGTYEIYDGRVDYSFFHDTIMKRYRNLSTDGNIFECSFFQNSIECMILFYEMSDTEIVAFYNEAFHCLKDKNFRMIYLDSSDIAGNIKQIKKERVDTKGNEIWFSLMMEYLTKCPYGKAHGYQDMEDLIAHLEHRRKLELRIIGEVLKENGLVVKAKAYDKVEMLNWVRE